MYFPKPNKNDIVSNTSLIHTLRYTSLNVGTPIVQTPKQALHALRKSKGMHGLIFISDNNDIYIAWDKNMEKKMKLQEQMNQNENLQKFNKIIQLSMVDVLKEFEQKTKLTFKKEIF